MKMVREEVEALVSFRKSSACPIIVTCSQGNIKVNKIIRQWKERRNLRECLIYLCDIDGRIDPAELRWEVESNRWFLEKF